MNHLFNTTFSFEFIEKWKFLLRELYNYKFYDEFALVSSLLGRKTYSYLPLLNYTDKTNTQIDDLLEKIKRKKYQIRVLNPEYRDFQENDTVTMRVDLNKKDIEELFLASVSKRNRRYIRQYNKEKVGIKKGNSKDLINDFYGIFTDVMYRHGTPVFSRRLFEILSNTFNTMHYVVYNNGKPIAAAVIIDDQKISWVPWSGTHSKYRDSRPGLIMYWETIKDAFDKKKLIYDFGRSNYGSGTYIYKIRWGAVPVKIDIFRHKTSNVYTKYKHVSYIWKKLPFSIACHVGPKLCKYLSDL